MGKKKNRYLIGRPSPRIIPEVLDEKLDCDVVLAKNYQHWQAMQEIRNYFLKHKQDYDYLIIAPDDLVVKQTHFNQLRHILDELHYPVLSGVCNVDESDYTDPNGMLNVSMELPSKKKPRTYKFLRKYDILRYPRVFTVKFAGFPLMAIEKRIIEHYEFPSDSIFKGERPQQGYSFDLVFCYWCHENNIPIRVDRRIYMQHLRITGENQVGKQAEKTIFIKH